MTIYQVIISNPQPPLEKPVEMSDALHLLGAIAIYGILAIIALAGISLAIRKIREKAVIGKTTEEE